MFFLLVCFCPCELRFWAANVVFSSCPLIWQAWTFSTLVSWQPAPFTEGLGKWPSASRFFPSRLVSLECIPWGLDCTYRAGGLVLGPLLAPGLTPTKVLGEWLALGATSDRVTPCVRRLNNRSESGRHWGDLPKDLRGVGRRRRWGWRCNLKGEKIYIVV